MNDEERKRLTEEIFKAQRQMLECIQAQDEPEWMGIDLTMPQFKIMHLLYSHGPMRMSELATRLGKNISTATGIVDHLVEDNYLQRHEDPKDRRAVVVRLTENGFDICESFNQQGQHTFQRLMAHMNIAELKIVLQSFELISRAARAEVEAKSQSSKKLED